MEEKEAILPNLSYENSRKSRPSCSLSCRNTLAVLGCLGFCVVYSLRVNLSVALVAMVNSTFDHGNTLNPECRGNGDTDDSSKNQGEFDWDQETQGIILGSFFYGYIITQLPGGWLASRFGGKHLFGVGVLCTSVFTLLTPWAARRSVGTLVGLRVLEGLGEGVTFPAMHAMWSSWAPPLERSKLATFTYAGAQMGTIISLPLSGFLCDANYLGGWPTVFYLFGSLGIIWFLVWTALVYDKPADHPRISAEEKDYILKAIGTSQDIHKKGRSTPWLAIWTSPFVWAIIIGHVCNNWGFYTFLTSLPSYFKEVLNFKILQNGLLSAVPYAAQYSMIVFGGQLADWLRNKRFLSTSEVRKLFTLGGFLPPACLLVATSYTGCNDKALSVALFSTALGISGLTASGFNVNHLDIAPRYAGVLMGITNMFATIPGIVAPYITGWLTNDKPTRGQWQKVFYLAAILYVIGALSYLILGTGKEQRWNTPDDALFIPVDIPRERRKPLPVFRDREEPEGAASNLVVTS